MGIFYEYFGRGKKKNCTLCGCILCPGDDVDICVCCLDELYNSDSGKEEDLQKC